MLTRIIEATNRNMNHGKFMLGWLGSQEYDVKSAVDGNSVVGRCGWTRRHLLVIDLQTGEGAFFKLGGLVSADLKKHAIWVCPLFEPFLEWLYEQPIETFADVEKLPALVQLPNAEFIMQGHRRIPDLDAIKLETQEVGAQKRKQRRA